MSFCILNFNKNRRLMQWQHYAEFSYYKNKKRNYKSKSFTKERMQLINSMKFKTNIRVMDKIQPMRVYLQSFGIIFENFKNPFLRPITSDKWLNIYSIIKKLGVTHY